jgi:hypothetical protein
MNTGWAAALFSTLPIAARGEPPSPPETLFEAVSSVAGAFQARGGGPLTAGGTPLQATDVAARAGKRDGFDVRVDGRSIFDLDYAHAAGRREPLRPQAADLSDS